MSQSMNVQPLPGGSAKPARSAATRRDLLLLAGFAVILGVGAAAAFALMSRVSEDARLGTFLVVTGVTFLVLAAYDLVALPILLRGTLDRLRRAVPATGTIESIERGGNGARNATLNYPTAAGEWQRATVPLLGARGNVGEALTIRYDPEEPAWVTTGKYEYTRFALRLSIAALGVLSVAMIAVGLVLA